MNIKKFLISCETAVFKLVLALDEPLYWIYTLVAVLVGEMAVPCSSQSAVGRVMPTLRLLLCGVCPW